MTRRARLCALAAASCASSGPVFDRYAAIPSGKGRLYVYQPPATFGAAEVVWLAGHELAKVGAGEYVTIAIAPGRYTFTFAGGLLHPDFDRRIHIRAGQAVYCGYLPDQDYEKTKYFCTDEKEDHDYDLRLCSQAQPNADPAWEP
jgi:hypothetical protein